MIPGELQIQAGDIELNSGLATLTHTPSPMGFLNQILDRPKNERPFLLLVVGYPAENARVPVITKKPPSEIATFIGEANRSP